jgi:hypothetical protein
MPQYRHGILGAAPTIYSFTGVGWSSDTKMLGGRQSVKSGRDHSKCKEIKLGSGLEDQLRVEKMSSRGYKIPSDNSRTRISGKPGTLERP